MKRAAVSVLLVLAAIPTLAGDGHGQQVGGPVIYVDVIYNKGPDGASQGRVPEYAANADVAACLRRTMTEKHLPVQFANDQQSARYLLHIESGDYEDCARLEQQGILLVCAGYNRSTRITGAQLLDTTTQQVVWSSDERKKWNGISLGWPREEWECRTADFAKRLANFIKKK